MLRTQPHPTHLQVLEEDGRILECALSLYRRHLSLLRISARVPSICLTLKWINGATIFSARNTSMNSWYEYRIQVRCGRIYGMDWNHFLHRTKQASVAIHSTSRVPFRPSLLLFPPLLCINQSLERPPRLLAVSRRSYYWLIPQPAISPYQRRLMCDSQVLYCITRAIRQLNTSYVTSGIPSACSWTLTRLWTSIRTSAGTLRQLRSEKPETRESVSSLVIC
jgi:hypothetical protein